MAGRTSQQPLSAPDPWQVDLGDRASKLPKVKLADTPSPIVARAEQLCDLVDDADGIRPDRQDLVAALIHAAADDGRELAQIWQAYRIAPVHEILRESNLSGATDLRSYKKR